MGSWDSEQAKLAKMSNQAIKDLEQSLQELEHKKDAAQAFVTGCAALAPQVTAFVAQLQQAHHESAVIADQLSALEKEFAKAKKDKDKEEMKNIEARIVPLEERFRGCFEQVSAAKDQGDQAVNAVAKLLKAIG